MWKALSAAGLGGIMPTLCRLAAAYGGGSDPPPLGSGLLIALFLFFVIGTAVAFFYGESDLRKAFTLGIAAPAIITSTINAGTQGKIPLSATKAVPEHSQIDRIPDGLARLFGIADAIADGAVAVPAIRLAQASPSGAAQLTIQPSLLGAANNYPIDPINLQFLSVSGASLSSTTVSAKTISTLVVPDGARSITVGLDGVRQSLELPGNLVSANLAVGIETSRLSDFQWAIGNSKPVRVEGVRPTLTNIKTAQPVAMPAPTSSPTETLKPGLKVYSESGQVVGVVESVKPAAPNQQPQVVIKAERTTAPGR